MDDYLTLADRIAADIAAGRLRPGQRLPPQRAFARRRGIAASTAGRVYGELVRRGLVVGEVGRGTFVRAAPDARGGRALAEPSTIAPVNLELNYPTAPGQSGLLAPALAPLLHPEALGEALRPAAATGTAAAREAAAALLGCPEPARLLFTGNARQAIAAALASLVRPGGRAGVEELTYPLVKEIAARLGITLVPLATDEDGLLPESLADAHRRAPLSALYVQPTLHNPTSLTTSEERRRRLARTASDLGIPIVEDRIWSFLRPEPPLAVHAPHLTHVVDGLSKRVAPGLTVGFLVVPPERVDAVAAVIRSGGWSAGRFALQAAVRWIEDGTVRRLVAAKRADAARRQRIVRRWLGDFAVRSDPHAYYAWWELPAPWRADTFTAAAAAHGIAVTPGTAFAVGANRTPDAVRLGLASAAEAELERAARLLADVAGQGRSDR
ncbi:aminotransferase-like domain-containing protein [Streptomyces chromofuscus]|uniref:PLP-dependent aminotransferase family protein n=1 Tax=Streptomyces chromofuscus TaxID=42881 RepID=A0A7M2TJ04_STRCW|nr:PLP-dependent aminotransferase family protein [Streptomyces chromofuscus]QOV47668.1 PLP-dependent aminotransferase family protein [Streptomyces chromofuscus]